jgi:hypothetical protein
MANILEMFKKGIAEDPPPVYKYEMYGKTNGEPIYAWMNMDTGKWTQDDFKGRMLPKGAIKEYSESLYTYQKSLLDKGQFLPQNPTPPVAVNKDTKERGVLKKIFSYLKGL